MDAREGVIEVKMDGLVDQPGMASDIEDPSSDTSRDAVLLKRYSDTADVSSIDDGPVSVEQSDANGIVNTYIELLLISTNQNILHGSVVKRPDERLHWVPGDDITTEAPTGLLEYLHQVNELVDKMLSTDNSVAKKLKCLDQDKVEVKPVHENREDGVIDGMTLRRHHLATAVVEDLSQSFPDHPIIRSCGLIDNALLSSKKTGHSLWDSPVGIGCEGYRRELHGNPIVSVSLGRSGHSDHLNTLMWLYTDSEITLGNTKARFFAMNELELNTSCDGLSFERPRFLPTDVSNDLKSILPYLPCQGIDMNTDGEPLTVLPWTAPTLGGSPLFGATHALPIYRKCQCDSQCHWQLMTVSRVPGWNALDWFIKHYFQTKSITCCGLPREQQHGIVNQLLSDLMRALNTTTTAIETIPYYMRTIVAPEKSPFLSMPKTFFKLMLATLYGLKVIVYSEHATLASSFIMSVSGVLPFSASGRIMTPSDIQTLHKDHRTGMMGPLGRLGVTGLVENTLVLTSCPLPFKGALLSWIDAHPTTRSYLIGCSHPLQLDPVIMEPDIIYSLDSRCFIYQRVKDPSKPNVNRLLNSVVPSVCNESGGATIGRELSSYQLRYLKNSTVYVNSVAGVLWRHQTSSDEVQDDVIARVNASKGLSSFAVPTLWKWKRKSTQYRSLGPGRMVAPVSLPNTSAYHTSSSSYADNTLFFEEFEDGLPMIPSPQLSPQIDGHSVYGEVDCLAAVLGGMGYNIHQEVYDRQDKPMSCFSIDVPRTQVLYDEWHIEWSLETHQSNVTTLLMFRYIELLCRLTALTLNSSYLLCGSDNIRLRLSSNNNPWMKEFGGEESIRELIQGARYAAWRAAQSLPIVPKLAQLPSYGVDTWGSVQFPNGDHYTGYFRDALRYGYGVYVNKSTTNGVSYYDGMWKADKRHGRGIYVISNRLFYRGNWQHDICQGTNQLTVAIRPTVSESSVYFGDVHGGSWHGHGTKLTSTGELYHGNFEMNYMGGAGQIRYPGGRVVIGSFLRHQRHGSCAVIDGNIQFRGLYEHGVITDKACVTVFESSGVHPIARFTCIWEKGIMHGPARLELFNKESYQKECEMIGQWKDGKINDRYPNWTISWPGGTYSGEIRYLAQKECHHGIAIDYHYTMYDGSEECEEDIPQDTDLKFKNRSFMLSDHRDTKEDRITLLTKQSDSPAKNDTDPVQVVSILNLPCIVPHGHGTLTNTDDGISYRGQFYYGMMHGSATVTHRRWAFKGDFAWGVAHGNGTLQGQRSGVRSGIMRNGIYVMSKARRVDTNAVLPSKSELHPKHWLVLEDFKIYDVLHHAPELRGLLDGRPRHFFD